MQRTITVFLLLLPAMAANAQAPQQDPEQEPRRYTVEMIVFTYAQDIGSGGEIFAADPAPGDTQPMDTAANGDKSIPAKRVVYPDTGFARLNRGDFTMGNVRSRLGRLGAYQPVMHFGWTQATYPAEQTRAIKLTSLAATTDGIDGTVKLYLNRFLHLVVDLQMDAETDPSAGAFASTGPLRYRIEEDRIFRSGELRYFDHPKFGVLAKVTRVEEVDDPAPDTEELLGYPIE